MSSLKPKVTTKTVFSRWFKSYNVGFLKGRHCLANRDIKSGETLFIEKPYSAILLPEFSHEYCLTCFKKVYHNGCYNFLNLEFCNFCTNVIYCSNECRIKNKFHRYECQILKSLLHNLGIAHLAYRIVASTDLNILNEYALIEKLQMFKDPMSLEYRDLGEHDDYEQVFYLLTHEADTHTEDLFKYTLTSIVLAKAYLKFR